MRKFYLLMTVMLLAVGAYAAEKLIYCKVSQDWWKADGAAVAAYAWSGEGESAEKNAPWPGLRMNPVAGQTDVWSTNFDLGAYEKIIFARVNGEGDIQYWDAKTANLTIPTDDHDLYVITSENAVWGDPGVAGEWTQFVPGGDPDPDPDPDPQPEDPSVKAKGSWDEWASELPFELAEDKKSATLVIAELAAGDYTFKLIVNGDWRSNGYEYHRGYTGTAGISANGDDMKLKADVAGKYTITWTFANDSIGIIFPEKGDDPDPDPDPEPEDPSVKAKGSWDEWASELPFELAEDKKSATLMIAELAAGDYTFKLIVNGDWRSNGYEYHRGYTGTAGISANGDDMKLKADVAGKYTITWTFANDSIGIIFPEKGDDPDPDPDPEPTMNYYVAGSMTEWQVSEEYKLVPNPEAEGEYMGEFTFVAGDKFKVVYSDGATVTSDHWFPQGMENEYQITEDGTYTVYFRPAGGVEGWHEGCIYVVKGETPDPQPEQRLSDGYYLIGSKTEWSVEKLTADLLFATNEGQEGEFVLTTTLEIEQAIKVVKVEKDVIVTWFPDGEGNEYKVDADHAGEKTIYFRPAGNEEWGAFGGFIWIDANPNEAIDNTADGVKAVKVLRDGQVLIIKGNKTYNILGTKIK